MNNVVEFLVRAKDEASKVIDSIDKKIWSLSKTAWNTARSLSERWKDNKDTFGWMQKYGGAATLATVWLWTAAVWQASKMQELRIELDVLTWSAKDWMKLFGDIQKEASKTPFESEDLVKTASTMLQFGVAQEDVMKDMRMLGDISGGNADKLWSLGLVYWQVQSAWKLMWQDLLQMINLWFNPLKAMSDQTGESMWSLREKMEDWQISFEMVKETMMQATSEWWLFFWMMDKKSQTFGGVMSTFKDNVWIALAALWWFSNGEVIEWWLLDTLTDWMKNLMPYLESFTNRAKENPVYAKNIMLVVAWISAFVLMIWSFGLILPSLITWFTAVASWLWFIKLAFLAVGWPVTLLITLLAWLAVYIYKNFDEIKAFWVQVWTDIKDRFSNNSESIVKVLEGALRTMVWFMTLWLSELVILVYKNRDEIKNFISNALTAIWEWLKSRWESVKKTFSDLWNGIKDFFGDTRESMKTILYDAINIIVTFISSSRDAVSNAFNNMVWWIAGVAKSVLNGAIWVIEWFVNRAVDGLNNLIALANAVPGVSLSPVKYVSFWRLAYGGIAGEGFFWTDGGAVRGPAWIDQVPTMLTAGEVVLNRAQQTNLANQLESWSWWKSINLVFENNNFYWSDRQMLKNMWDMLVEELKLHAGFASF